MARAAIEIRRPSNGKRPMANVQWQIANRQSVVHHFESERSISMTTQTRLDLNEQTIEAVQDLIQANIDSADGFQEAAKQVEDSNIAALFTELEKERRRLTAELQVHVQLNGERPRTEGSWLASIHQTWIDLRAKLNSGDAHVLLCEAERGEDFIKHAYEDVLKRTAGSPMQDVLTTQHAIIKEGHDRVRDLRDHYKQTAAQ